MSEEALRELAKKLTELECQIDILSLRVSDIRDLHEDIHHIVVREGQRLGIDPYEVKEF
jgi:hypothetical protein